MGPIGCREKPARNYHYFLRNNPEERSSLGLGLLVVFPVLSEELRITTPRRGT